MFDVLQLQNLLLTRYRELEERKASSRHPLNNRLTKRHILSYFILEVGRIYESSQELLLSVNSIRRRLSVEASEDIVSCRVLLSTHTKVCLAKFNHNVPSLGYMELLMKNFDQPTFMLFSHLSKHFDMTSTGQKQLCLSYWMAAVCCYQRSCNEKLVQLFFRYGELLTRSSGIAMQVSQSVQFAKLVGRNRFCPAFLFMVMDRIPYAK